MKVLVAYMSKTGNTRKVAEAMFEGIEDEKEIKRIDEVDSLEGYDISFLGFPVMGMGPDRRAAAFLETHCAGGREVVLFMTHASPEDGEDLPPMLEKFRDAARGGKIVDLFHCQGQLARGVKLFMSIYPNAKFRQWAKLDNSKGQPDQSRLDRAREFSGNVMQRLHETGKTETEGCKVPVLI
jgi:flavodoxin